MKRMSGMGEYFEPIMSMVLAASLRAIAAAVTVRYSVIDKSWAVVATLAWLIAMKECYDWNIDPNMADVVTFFPPLWPMAVFAGAAYCAQLVLGILILAMSFRRTRIFLVGNAGSGTL